MMKRKFSNIFIPVLAFLLGTSMTVSAVDWQISKSKTASPAELREGSTTTDVSLQLPAANRQRTIDIVFVMDKSSSAKRTQYTNYFNNSVAMINELHTKASASNDIDIRVAIVKYRGNAFDMVSAVTNGAQNGLVSVKTSEGTATVQDALALDEVNSGFFSFSAGEDHGTGSNIHGGIQMANNILSADTSTLAGDKYMVLYTDGLGYLWNDENGVPQTIYTQVVQSGNLNGLGYGEGSKYNQSLAGMPNADQRVAKDKYFDANSTQYIPDGVTPLRFGSAFNSANVYADALTMFNAMMETDNPEFTGTSPYERDVIFNGHAFSIANQNVITPADSAYTITAHTIQNASALPNMSSFTKYYEPDSNYCIITPYLQSNPYEVVKVGSDYYYANVDNGNGTYSYDSSVASDAAHFIVNDDYFMLHATSIEKGTYMAAKEFDEMADAGYHLATFYFDNSPANQEYYLGTGLRQYLASKSDYSSESRDSTNMAEVFSDMKTDMNYLIAEGTVTDPIPADFDLVTDTYGTGMPFEVTVGGVPQTASGSGSFWTFGSADSVTDEYPYTVSYNSSARVITFDINVPVDASYPVALNYELDLINRVTGIYPTNGTTVLAYTDSAGDSGTENFDVPSVTYVSDELSLRTVTDTGFYCDSYMAEADASTHGAIAVTAYINNYSAHKDNIDLFGFYLGYSDHYELTLSSGQDAVNWNKTQDHGAFYTILYNIPFTEFGNSIDVKPFLITSDNKAVEGDPVSVSVTGINKWLGSEAVMLQNHSMPKTDN